MLLCPFCQAPLGDNDGWHCVHCNKQPERKGVITFLSPHATHANFSEESFALLSDVEEDGHFWFEGRNKLIVSLLQRHVPNFSKYLEIGCGTGFVFKGIADAFPKATVCGSEFYSTGLNIAAARTPRAEFFQMDANNIPFREEFDLLGAFDVLEHIEDDVLVLNEMAKALKPAGHVLIAVPQHAWMWSATDVWAGHVRRYTKQDLTKKLNQAGFTPVKTTSFVSLLLPCMYLSRLTKRAKDNAPKESELRLGFLNTIFSIIMTLERKLIECGVPFPVGGSLLILARKNP